MEPLADPDQYHMCYQALPPSHTPPDPEHCQGNRQESECSIRPSLVHCDISTCWEKEHNKIFYSRWIPHSVKMTVLPQRPCQDQNTWCGKDVNATLGGPPLWLSYLTVMYCHGRFALALFRSSFPVLFSSSYIISLFPSSFFCLTLLSFYTVVI